MQVNYKRLSLFLVFACILLGSSLTYVVLSQGTNIPTITSGPYAGAPSYTIYKEGSTYYAKNAYGNNDYEGTNAVTIINYAFSALNGVNWEKVLLKGYITIDSQLIISQSYTILEVQGTIIREDDTSSNLLSFNTKNHVEIIGGLWDGNKVNAPSGNYGIYVLNSSDVQIHNLEIKNNAQRAIQILGAGSDRVWVYDNYIHDNDCEGVATDGTGTSNYPTDVKVYANTFENNKRTDILFFANSLESYNAKMQAYGNIILGSGVSGIAENGISVFASYSRIHGNYIENVQDNGIEIKGGYYSIIEGNTVLLSRQNGIAVLNSSYVEIKNNIVFNNGQVGSGPDRAGLRIFETALYISVSGQYYDLGGATQQYGIIEESPSNWNTIINANAFGNAVVNILVSGANTQINSCYNGTVWIT